MHAGMAGPSTGRICTKDIPTETGPTEEVSPAGAADKKSAEFELRYRRLTFSEASDLNKKMSGSGNGGTVTGMVPELEQYKDI